uniref:ABC1 atypical kinase-like domain-containing protein n=1 Tax=Oryza rufipogon TaxID=4529 RepID=A0A0E0Q289_ORYRU
MKICQNCPCSSPSISLSSLASPCLNSELSLSLSLLLFPAESPTSPPLPARGTTGGKVSGVRGGVDVFLPSPSQPRGRFVLGRPRRLKVFSMALFIYFDYKAVQKRVKWVGAGKKDAIWTKTHERNARRVLNLMIELEGLWVKMGQYLSTRADVLPEPYINVLKQLQDSLPPRPLEEVRGTIEKELGKPMNDLFANFVLDPLATASIAQVHRATLVDGREVVVKIQHDGIKDIILEDLKNAKSLVEWIAWAEPQYNFNPMIDEWCKEAPKELDFNHEAENTKAVSSNLSRKTNCESGAVSSAVDVLIPEVIQSTDKVLILQYMDGIRLNDNDSLEAYGVDKQRLVEEITRAYAHQIYVDGFFNGDPHPGNFLVSKEPPHKPILLDFGLTKRISQSMRQALAKMFLSCAEGDHVALLSAFAEMGLKLRVDMPEQAMEIATVFFRQSTTANEAKENIKTLNDQRERNVKALQEKMKMNKKEVQRFNPVDAFPGDAIIFMRVLNLLRGLSASLNVRIVYLDIMRPFAESTLLGSMTRGPTANSQWIYDSPVNSEVESKLRNLLLELGSNKILGIQVCAYKDGKVIIDTAAGGAIPPPHSGGGSKPPLGSHVHTPKFPTMPSKKKKKGGSKNDVGVADKDGYTQLRTSDGSDEGSTVSAVVAGNGSGSGSSMFVDGGTKMLDAFMGVGDFSGMIHPNGKFGLGFRRYGYGAGAGEKVATTTFGHSGMGGSTGFCDVEHGLAMAVTVNKMSLGGVTRRVVRLVCEELGVPVPDEFSVAGDKGPDMVLNLAPPE